MSHKLDRLRRLYPRLTVSERVALALAAQARGDHADLEALDASCPGDDLYTYLFTQLALERLASLLVVRLLAYRLLLVVCFAHVTGDDDPQPSPDAALVTLLRLQAALWGGFVACCQDLSLDPHLVLALAPIGPDDGDPARFILRAQIEEAAASADDGLLDPDHVETFRRLFHQAFGPLSPSLANSPQRGRDSP